MADTCYGQPVTGPSEPSVGVADEVRDRVAPGVVPVDPPPSERGPQPLPTSRQLALSVTKEPIAPPSSRSASKPTAETAEPRLALEQMTPVIEGGMFMVFGPEGDPVPPQAFADAAVSRADLQLRLPDGRAVRADRIATVLRAQTLGRLGAAEQGDAWILTMLGQGDGPEMAPDQVLQAEHGEGPEPASEEMLLAERDHCVLTLLDRQMVVASGDEAFRIFDIEAGGSAPGSMRLMLRDDTPISIRGLNARLRDAAEAAVQGSTKRVATEAADQDPADPPGAETLVIAGCTIEVHPDSVALGLPGAALAGKGFRLARQVSDGSPASLVGMTSTTGRTANLEDLIGIAFAAGRAAAIGHERGAGEHDFGGIGHPDGRTHPDADRGDPPGAELSVGVGVHPGVGLGAAVDAEAGDGVGLRDREASDDIVALFDPALPDQVSLDHGVLDPVVGIDEGPLPQVWLDLDSLATMTAATLDLDFDFPIESLDGATDIADGEPDDRLGAADLDPAPGDRLQALTDQPSSLDVGSATPHRTPEAMREAHVDSPEAGDHADQPEAATPSGPVESEQAGHQADQLEAAAPSRSVVSVRAGDHSGRSDDHDAVEQSIENSAGDETPGASCLADDRSVDSGALLAAVECEVAPEQHNGPARQADFDPAGWVTEPGTVAADIAPVRTISGPADVDLARGLPEVGSVVAEVAPVQAASGQADVDPESIALVVIRGVPEDATLSTGTRDEDGSWSISPLDLSSVTIRLAGEGVCHRGDGVPSAIEGELDITGIAITEGGDLVAISERVPLADYVAEPTPAHVAIEPVGGYEVESESRMIPLNVDPRAWAGEPYAALVIRDLPAGARLSAGSYDPSIDAWVLMPHDLATLAIAPPAGLRTGFTLTLMGVTLPLGDGNPARVLARMPVAPM